MQERWAQTHLLRCEAGGGGGTGCTRGLVGVVSYSRAQTDDQLYGMEDQSVSSNSATHRIEENGLLDILIGIQLGLSRVSFLARCLDHSRLVNPQTWERLDTGGTEER